MGFFGSLLGNDQRRDIGAATKSADKTLNAASKAAKGDLNKGFDAQLAALAGGYNTATGNINTGYDRARGDLSTNYGNAEGAINTQLDYSKELLNPYIESGGKAQSRYDTALGLNGQDAASGFYDEYAESDPYRQFNEDIANQALQRLANASGQSGSGRTALAVSRANLERGSTDLNAYLDRLAGQGQQGGQYATNLAGMANNAGTNIANLRSGLGDRLASNEVNRGTTLGQMDYGYGQDQGNVAANRGSSLANLTYGTGQQVAGNRINLGNANAAARSTGVNNLLSLGATVGGLALGGFAPGAAGISAFGNMSKAFSGGGLR
jgi:hypothetical protein